MDSDEVKWPQEDHDNILRDLYTLLEPYEEDDPLDKEGHPYRDICMKETRERIKKMCDPVTWNTYTSHHKIKIIEAAKPFTMKLRLSKGKLLSRVINLREAAKPM